MVIGAGQQWIEPCCQVVSSWDLGGSEAHTGAKGGESPFVSPKGHSKPHLCPEKSRFPTAWLLAPTLRPTETLVELGTLNRRQGGQTLVELFHHSVLSQSCSCLRSDSPQPLFGKQGVPGPGVCKLALGCLCQGLCQSSFAAVTNNPSVSVADSGVHYYRAQPPEHPLGWDLLVS